jgi:general secretion pathway protein D
VVQFQYVDIGVNLDITPRVLLNREVSMTVLVQVQALAGDRDAGGVTLPVFTNRSIQHEIRLSEGETNILGGIIQDTEAVSISGLPGLKDIPLLRYLFSREARTRDETEIIIMLTPHIVRMPNISAMNMRGLNIGTEVNTRLRTPLVRPEAASESAGPQGTAASVPAAPAAPDTLPAQPAAATLAFTPMPVTLGTTPSVMNIGIDGSNIFAVDLTLSFDPSSMSIREINDGGFLGRDGQFVSVVQKIDTEAGTATVSLERAPGAPPVSGNGALLSLVVQGGARKGDSLFRVTDFRVRDARQVSQPGRPAEVRVTVP